MTAEPEPAGVCSWCHAPQPASQLVRRIASTTVVCADDTACAARVEATAEAEMPVSGRDEPREAARPMHHVRFLDLVATWTLEDGVRFGPFRVVCHDEPQISLWARSFDKTSGYTLADIENLMRQHHGVEPDPPRSEPPKRRHAKGKLAAIVAAVAVAFTITTPAHHANAATGPAECKVHVQPHILWAPSGFPFGELLKAGKNACSKTWRARAECSVLPMPPEGDWFNGKPTQHKRSYVDCATDLGLPETGVDMINWGFQVKRGSKWVYTRLGGVFSRPQARLDAYRATSMRHTPARIPPVHVQQAHPVLTIRTPTGGIGLQIIAAPADCTDTPFLQTDSNHAPMLWDTCWGLFSGGDGAAELGGQICSTYEVLFCASTITPVGTLILTPTGPAGATGPAETLTASGIALLNSLTPADVALLNQMTAAHVTARDLRWLAHQGGAR